MDIETRIQLDRAELTGIIRRALGGDRFEVATWHAATLGYDSSNPVSGGVYRVAGTATDGTRDMPWSLVLKVLRSPAGVTMSNGFTVPRNIPDDPAMFAFWKREALAYGAGLLDDLPGGLAAPRCYGLTPQGDEAVWLWLEDVADAHDFGWRLDRYCLAARQLGRFNGHYLTGGLLPTAPWFWGGWLRSWLHLAVAEMMEVIRQPEAWEDSLVWHALPQRTTERLLKLWDEREDLLAALDRLPRTFCHRDASPANLFARPAPYGQGQTVAIDWAFAGTGPLGEEVAPLVVIHPVGGPSLDPRRVEAAVFDGYLRGLREVGWRGDPRMARFGYAATAALRYAFLIATEMLCDAHDAGRATSGRERAIEQRAAHVSFLLGLADEARELMSAVPPRLTGA